MVVEFAIVDAVVQREFPDDALDDELFVPVVVELAIVAHCGFLAVLDDELSALAAAVLATVVVAFSVAVGESASVVVDVQHESAALDVLVDAIVDTNAVNEGHLAVNDIEAEMEHEYSILIAPMQYLRVVDDPAYAELNHFVASTLARLVYNDDHHVLNIRATVDGEQYAVARVQLLMPQM